MKYEAFKRGRKRNDYRISPERSEWLTQMTIRYLELKLYGKTEIKWEKTYN